MAKRYVQELNYLTEVMKKLRLHVSVQPLSRAAIDLVDLGLRQFLGLQEQYTRIWQDSFRTLRQNTIYKITDEFLLNYLFLLLPDTEPQEALILGPYIAFSISHEQVLEEAERFGVQPQHVAQLQSYYSNIPVIVDDSFLLVLLNSFGEILWGDANAYAILDINHELTANPVINVSARDVSQTDDMLLKMRMMEARYAYEEELMDIVSKGLVHRANLMLSNVSELTFESRAADPLRNLKNYLIILNTLLRKAAQRGGVHPLHLDEISSRYASRLETLTSVQDGPKLIQSMVRNYCRLVQKHSMSGYSPLISRTILLVESDLSADLHLNVLADAMGVSAGYLSSLFHKETKQTLTAFINEKRMLAAAHLLHTTKLQIQTVAQHCGFSDVNYFSKRFLKYHGVTPRQYRDSFKSLPHKKD